MRLVEGWVVLEEGCLQVLQVVLVIRFGIGILPSILRNGESLVRERGRLLDATHDLSVHRPVIIIRPEGIICSRFRSASSHEVA